MVPVVWAIADVNATIAIRLAIAVTRKLSAMAGPRITPAHQVVTKLVCRLEIKEC